MLTVMDDEDIFSNIDFEAQVDNLIAQHEQSKVRRHCLVYADQANMLLNPVLVAWPTCFLGHKAISRGWNREKAERGTT